MPSNYVEILVKARDEAKPDLADLQARLDALKATVAEARATADTADAAAKLDALEARLLRVDRIIANPKITVEGAVRAEAQIHAVEAALDRLNATGGTAAATAAAGARGFGLWGAAAAIAATRVTLFQGALNGFLPAWLTTVGGFHLAADAVGEFLAVVGPAVIGLAAFGAAAAPTVQDIVAHMKDIATVSQATGANIYPLTGAFSKLAAAVKPQVYQLFGDALSILGQKTGGLKTDITGIGQALDQLGARFALAITSGSGFSGFLSKAAADVAGLGDIAGNLGGALGNVLKVVPGYAQVLLNFADAGSKVIEWATSVGQPVIKAGLAFHGAFLYVGLGATLLSNAVRGGITAVGNWAEKAGTALLATDRFGAAGARAGSALLGFSADAASAAALPWGWIAIAAAGIGFLAYKLITAKDATQQWLSGLQALIGGQSAATGLTSIMGAQVQVADRLAAAQRNLASAQRTANEADMAAAGTFNGLGGYSKRAADHAALAQAQGQVADLTSGQRQLNDETTLYLDRLGKLGAAFGSVTAAQGLLTAAGIKMSEMLDKSKWAQILQQVTAVSLAYQAMGQRSGVLGADLNALTIAGSGNVTAMSRLNQAWTSVIGIVAGGQSAFITFEQSLQSAATAGKAAGASMDGLSAPSLALRAAWQQAYANGSNLINALRMMSSASPGGFLPVKNAVKDIVSQLIPLGRQSSATRAELVSLAQEVDPTITRFSQLASRFGGARNAGADLNKILAADGLNLQNLAKDAASLAGAVQNSVTAKFDAAKMAANGTNNAITALANAIGKGGATASQVHGDMVTLYNDLLKDGLGAQAAAALVSTLSGQLFKV